MIIRLPDFFGTSVETNYIFSLTYKFILEEYRLRADAENRKRNPLANQIKRR